MNKNLKDWVFSRIEFNACDCCEKPEKEEEPKRQTRQNKRSREVKATKKEKQAQTWDYDAMVEHLKFQCKN